MTSYAFGPLNGSGPQQVYVGASYIAYDQAGNYSTYWGEVRYYGNGYGSWDASSAFSWSANFGGHVLSGTWNIPYARRNDAYTTLWAGYFSIYHDALGFGAPFTISAYLDTNHTSIGDGGASTTEPAAPRIPKPPTPPLNVRLASALPTALTIAWDAPADNRGAAILDYRARLSTQNPADVGTALDLTAPAAARSVTFENLRPGTTYYAIVYARNGAGTSAKSDQLPARTNSGAYEWMGGAWSPVELLTYTPSGWRPGEVNTRTATGWQQAL